MEVSKPCQDLVLCFTLDPTLAQGGGGAENGFLGRNSLNQCVYARPADTNAARKFGARAGLLFAATRDKPDPGFDPFKKNLEQAFGIPLTPETDVIIISFVTDKLTHHYSCFMGIIMTSVIIFVYIRMSWVYGKYTIKNTQSPLQFRL